MGREIKRVALDFDYPINKMIWKGYANPYRGLECAACDGTGQSPEFKELSDNWYAFEDESKQWCYSITQDEVRALADKGRLMDFTHIPINDEQKEIVKKKVANGGNNWLPFNNGYIPTAAEVNLWAKNGPLNGHDAINRWICVETRAKRLGITETHCKYCSGEGVLWAGEKYAKLSEEFEGIDPPEGDGYQLWSTTTEGTPMSPVFDTPEKLAKWLSDNNASSFGHTTATYDQWLKFINGPAWCPSFILDNKGIRSGVVA